MHGRLKVRTTEEQQLIKKKEQKKKLAAYHLGLNTILSTRKRDSYDPDSLNIASQLLVLNPDIYTLWNYRKEVVLMVIKEHEEKDTEDKLIEFLESELKLTENCLLSNPKSYGSWHHRFWVLDHHPKPNWQREFEHCTKYFTYDDRNFLCWDYRRLVLNKVGLSVDEERNFCTERLNVNFSNYSAWHYRSTLRKLDADGIRGELELIKSAIFTDPFDSSAWFYLRWVLSSAEVEKEHLRELNEALDQLLELEPDCKWILIAKGWLSPSEKTDCYQKLATLDPLRKGHYVDACKDKTV